MRKINEDELQEIADEMRQVASDDPCQVLALVMEGKGPPEKYHRRFSLNGFPLHVCLTLTYFGTRSFFQLSCQDERYIILPASILDLLTEAFFGGDLAEGAFEP